MYRFPKNSRVCFIGDSITHLNLSLAYIVDYYRKNLADNKIEFYNCGISGGTVSTALSAFSEDVLPFSPTHTVVCLGMNDSMRDFLNSPKSEKYGKLTKAYRDYKENLSKLADKIESAGSKLILCTPTPYAEYVNSSREALKGGAALLLGYAEYVRRFASERKLPLCDYHSYITEKMQTEKLYGDDRVHPLGRGFWRMADCFLKFQGFSLGDMEPLSAEVGEWHAAVLKIRDTVAAEHFVLNDDFSKTPEQRMKLIREFAAENRKGAEYETMLARNYSETKPLMDKYIKFAKEFMKK